MVKNPLAMQETWVRSLGWEDTLEEGMATHSSNSCLRNSMDQKKKERESFNPYHELQTRSNSKWITDLNIKPKTIKLIEENIGKISS